MKSSRPALVALLAFAFSLPVLALGSSWIFHRAFPDGRPWLDQDLGLQGRLPVEWLDLGVLRVQKVRRREEFWAFEKSNVEGTALRVLETPALREALYPGYPPEMFADRELWRAYASRDFSSTAWLPPLQPYSSYGILTYQSWMGCLDIFRRQGADVVIFGSSETFRSLVPQVLSGDKARKVLLCTTTSSYPEQAQWVAREMAKPGMPRAQWVIFGISLWSLHQGHDRYLSIQAEKRSLLDRYLASRYGQYEADVKAAEVLRPPTWDDLYSPNLSAWSRHRSRAHGPTTAADYFARQPETVATGAIARKVLEGGDFGAALAGFKPSFPLLDGVDEKLCAPGALDAEGLLGPSIRAVARIADHTLLYVPPISPRMRAVLPGCYLDTFARALQSFGDGGAVTLAAEKAEDYGLADSDYLYAGDLETVVKYEAVHTNFAGAVKVSRRIESRLAGVSP